MRALFTSGMVVAAVFDSSPTAMLRLPVVASARVTFGTASAGSPVSSTSAQLALRPSTPPALFTSRTAA